ncbi:MAG: heavy metal translocating P-type ATPase [Elusimicrobiota bacterium]
MNHKKMVQDFRTRFWVSLILTLPILILSPMIKNFLGITGFSFKGDTLLLFGFSSAVFFYGGWPFLKGLYNEIKKSMPGMMTLIALAISVAYFYSSSVVFGVEGKLFFWELATLIDIMLLGHWIEMKSVMGATGALKAMAQLIPNEAHRIKDNGDTEEVKVSQLNKNDKILIKPGEKISADGEVVDGQTYINESLVTGESKPVSKKKGDKVIGGSVNEKGSIKVEVKETGKDSYLSRMMDMVKKAQESKSRSQNLADRAAFWLTIIAISAGLITLAAWLVFMNRDFAFSLERMVTVMVITCPHALGLAIPLVVAASTTLSAKNGLLIRNRTAFEKALNLQSIIFDKTGTLTMGTFGVTDIAVLSEDFSKKEVLKYAASVEQNSEHPIGRGIVEESDSLFDKVQEFNSISGKGVTGKVNGKEVKVVSPGYLEENDIQYKGKKINATSSGFAKENNESKEDESIDNLLEEGKTLVFLLIDNQLKGAIALADVIREESREAIAKLKNMGIQCMMLTGDNSKVAKWVADELGLDEYFAEVLPDKKAEKVKEVQDRGLTVAMAGDGVNDAPALAQADVGIAIGSGTDIAAETADIILVKSNPLDVAKIIGLAKATYRKMVQNLAWATGYNAFAIPLAAGVLYKAGILLSPAAGAILMSLSTVIVAVNARFLKVEE